MAASFVLINTNSVAGELMGVGVDVPVICKALICLIGVAGIG